MAANPEVVINRPVAEVFDYLADFAAISEYTTSFEHMTKESDGPVGKGTTYRYRLKTRGLEGTVEISEYEPGRRLSWTGPFAGPVSPRGSYSFEEVPAGTKVTAEPNPQFRGVIGLVAPLMRPSIRRDAQKSLRRVKQILESRPLA